MLFTQGSIILQEKKIKSNHYQYSCVWFGKHFGVIFVLTSTLDRKIQNHKKRMFLFLFEYITDMKYDYGYITPLNAGPIIRPFKSI